MAARSASIGIGIALLIIGGAIGYFGATTLKRLPQTGVGQRQQSRLGAFQDRQRQRQQLPLGGGRVIGKVQEVNDGRITVQTPNGSSQIILLNDSTSYQKMTNGSASDVTAGTQVLVTGQQNPDGSTTATTIQIIPEGMSMPFGARQSGQPDQNQQ